MQIRSYSFLYFFLSIIICSCVNDNASPAREEIETDSLSIKIGERLFAQRCASCHNFTSRGIGPNLGGIADSLPLSWLRQFIADPQKMLDANEQRAKQLVAQYKDIMPSFNDLSSDEVDDVIAYINVHKGKTGNRDSAAITDPIPDSIELSGIVINIKAEAQIPASAQNNKPPLARITKLDYMPGSDVLFIVDMRGKLYRLNSGTPETYFDLASLEPKFVHEPGLGAGFGSFAFHPAFHKNGLLYTVHTEKPGADIADFRYHDSIRVTYQYVLTEWKTTTPEARVFTGTPRELLRIDMVTVQHGIQEISFNPFAKLGNTDYGSLYICIGDGGAMDDKYAFLAGDPHMPWGTIFRIDPLGTNSVNGKYGIPADNPFKGKDGLGEVYAYGFRNPHRISWGGISDVYVANIGEAYIESIYRIKPGMHHGWPIREGTYAIDPQRDVTKLRPLNSGDSSVLINYPIAEYDHEWGYAAISGGFVYMGNSIPVLRGKYVFGDIPSGKLFFFDVHQKGDNHRAPVKEWQVALDGNILSLKKICNSKRVDLHFGRDASNELYILAKADGKLFKLISQYK